MSKSTHKIRPAARIIRTIGQDLIKDVYAAIVELVKNAYDADSSSVTITFNYIEKHKRLNIKVEDHGHGMSFDTVVNSWLVPATSDKLKRKKSATGRVYQGRKGIGRFAASVLGEHILLETIQDGKASSLLLDMEELDRIQYLDQFELDVEVVDTNRRNGTILEIESNYVTSTDVAELWTTNQIRKLLVELRSLISPQDVYDRASEHGHEINHDPFNIKLKFNEFPHKEFANSEIDITPFPVLELYDYRIFGTVDALGNAKIKFENQNTPNLNIEYFNLNILFDNAQPIAYPGEVYIDIRAYDRDPENIDKIIKRGFKDPTTGQYVGKQEARKILDEYFGIGIYRGQFRIRPYGDQSYDWLDLDKIRIQNPSRKIGHNQVMGFVFIRAEEASGLSEKSARDGLVENKEYYGLKVLVAQFINQLESRRFEFREKTGKGRKNNSTDQDVSDLFDLDSISINLKKVLNKIDLPANKKQNVNKAVDDVMKEEEANKSPIAKRLRNTLAIYQGQATLGKFTLVLLHEGRKHIKYISETVPRIVKWGKQLSLSPDNQLTDKLEERSEKVVIHAKGLSRLFAKIEPLARTRRLPPKILKLVSVISNSFDIFETAMNEQEINFDICDECQDPTVKANELDLITVFSNLVENSIYWHSLTSNESKFIHVNISESDDSYIISFLDNGPGFQGDNLERMFEPGYSMKTDGNDTGLGLSLAGEAMTRSGGTIEAEHSDVGALFRITLEKRPS